jgi:4-hydroxybutyryl-CoA dehydratase/vinylacetyl-CoA-Delta-isomerase
MWPILPKPLVSRDHLSPRNQLTAVLANGCKLNVTRFPYEIARLAPDVVGALLITMASEKDLVDPEMGSHLDRYLRAWCAM